MFPGPGTAPPLPPLPLSPSYCLVSSVLSHFLRLTAAHHHAPPPGAGCRCWPHGHTQQLLSDQCLETPLTEVGLCSRLCLCLCLCLCLYVCICLCALTGKAAGDDKKLGKVLARQLSKDLETDPTSPVLTSTPLGDLHDAATRRLLINLISTLNASFPDYDFSTIKPEDFLRVRDVSTAVSVANKSLAETLVPDGTPVLEQLWAAVNEAVVLKDCEVFSYIPDLDSDPFSASSLWSFNFFFVNKPLKKILFFFCIARQCVAELRVLCVALVLTFGCSLLLLSTAWDWLCRREDDDDDDSGASVVSDVDGDLPVAGAGAGAGAGMAALDAARVAHLRDHAVLEDPDTESLDMSAIEDSD